MTPIGLMKKTQTQILSSKEMVAVSIEAAMSDLVDVSDLEDKEEQGVERRNGEGGTKRKAAINKGEESDEDPNSAEEFEAYRILSGAEAFQKAKFSKVSPSGILIDDTYHKLAC